MPEIDEFLMGEKDYQTLKKNAVLYSKDNRPTSAVKKTYKEVCEEKGSAPQIEYIYKPSEEEIRNFVHANNLTVENGYIKEMCVHEEKEKSEKFEMPPPCSLFFNQ